MTRLKPLAIDELTFDPELRQMMFHIMSLASAAAIARLIRLPSRTGEG